jgi:hypothetical protein
MRQTEMNQPAGYPAADWLKSAARAAANSQLAPRWHNYDF